MPSAADRGLREFLAKYRDVWSASKAKNGIAPFNWREFEARARSVKHYCPFNDEEWNGVLAALVRAGISDFDADEVRKRIETVTLQSGYFRSWVIVKPPNRSEVLHRQNEDMQLADKIESLLPDIASYLGPLPGSIKEMEFDTNHDMRGILDYLREFIGHIRMVANNKLAWAEIYPIPPANSKRKPEFDRWGAGLIDVWAKTLNQPVKNGVALQRFLIACASPYGWLASTIAETSQRQARYFIADYLKNR